MEELVSRLRAAGCVFAEDEAAILLSTARDRAELDRLCALRVGGLPLEQVVGWAGFCGLRIGVAPGVFVPRRRSEYLARRAAAHAGVGATVLDMCCGTGALGLAISSLHEGVILHAVDSDPAAVACARANRAGSVHLGDLFEPLPGGLRRTFEVIVAVPPYVPSGARELLHREARLYEPAASHDGGPDGLVLVGRLLAGAGDWLAPGGVVLLEVSEAQGSAAVALAHRHGLSAHVQHDEALDCTVVIAAG